MIFKAKVSQYQNHGNGGRDCNLRYESIKEKIPKDKCITLLDVGSNMGYFSRQIAQDFNSLVYSIEHRKEDFNFHIEQIKKQNVNNNYVLKSLLNKEIIYSLFDGAEVFDVTLLLSVVHHFYYPQEEWCKLVGQFIKHSHYTFFELPGLDEEKEIANREVFVGWYEKYPENPYEFLLKDVASSVSLTNCEIKTIRTSYDSGETKDLRHLIIVTNHDITPEMPRYHAANVHKCQKVYFMYPRIYNMKKLLDEKNRDFYFGCKRLLGRIKNIPRKILRLLHIIK